jgi:hypothetical protein
MTDDCHREWRTTAVNGTIEEIRALRCDICGAGLRILFYSGRRNALNFDCLSCRNALRCDGVDEIPWWVKQFGGELITGKSTE